MQRSEILIYIKSVLYSEYKIRSNEVTLESKLNLDFGLNNVDFSLFLYKIESHYKINILDITIDSNINDLIIGIEEAICFACKKK